MSDVLRCQCCGEVIGVYEPLVRLLDGCAHESSRALEPGGSKRDGEHYHRACYERLDGDEPFVACDCRTNDSATP
jgi:hypothetical protein